MKAVLLLAVLVVHQVFADPPADASNDLYSPQKFAKNINYFSLQFLKKLDYAKKNTIFSPLGIGMAVGMLLKGSQGKHCEDVSKMFHYDECANKDQFHQQFKNLLTDYKDMNTRDENKRDVILELANLFLSAEGYNVAQSYLDALKTDYEASVGKEDFEKNGQAIMEKINKFVKERTHELIPSVLSEPLSQNTVIVLINTIFFKGHWLFPFNKLVTYNTTFHNADNTKSTVQMMNKARISLNHYYSEKLKTSMIEVPYNGNVSMYLLVPDEINGLANLIETVTAEDLSSARLSMKYTPINLHMPKFEYGDEYDLKEIFQKGFGVDIEPVLSSLDPGLKITKGIHKAKIQTHENGTEAAAVTLFAGERYSAINLPEPKVIKLDRPFAYSIRDNNHGVIWFAGSVSKFN